MVRFLSYGLNGGGIDCAHVLFKTCGQLDNHIHFAQRRPPTGRAPQISAPGLGAQSREFLG